MAASSDDDPQTISMGVGGGVGGPGMHLGELAGMLKHCLPGGQPSPRGQAGFERQLSAASE